MPRVSFRLVRLPRIESSTQRSRRIGCARAAAPVVLRMLTSQLHTTGVPKFEIHGSVWFACTERLDLARACQSG
jgi:hypothetical protein